MAKKPRKPKGPVEPIYRCGWCQLWTGTKGQASKTPSGTPRCPLCQAVVERVRK